MPLLVCLLWLLGAFAPRLPSPMAKRVPPKTTATPADVQVEVKATPETTTVTDVQIVPADVKVTSSIDVVVAGSE